MRKINEKKKEEKLKDKRKKEIGKKVIREINNKKKTRIKSRKNKLGTIMIEKNGNKSLAEVIVYYQIIFQK